MAEFWDTQTDGQVDGRCSNYNIDKYYIKVVNYQGKLFKAEHYMGSYKRLKSRELS